MPKKKQYALHLYYNSTNAGLNLVEKISQPYHCYQIDLPSFRHPSVNPLFFSRQTHIPHFQYLNANQYWDWVHLFANEYYQDRQITNK